MTGAGASDASDAPDSNGAPDSHDATDPFAEFVATRADAVDLADPASLQEAWQAWATLFSPGATEPDAAYFTTLAARAAPPPPTHEPSPPLPRPLATWAFHGTLRHYQADVLDRVEVTPGEPLHIVAPPGSGKTLLGLLLAAKNGTRTLVLAPTATIRSQWARSARELTDDPASVSEDPDSPGDLTALTYQMVSVLETGSPLTGLATEEWVTELVTGGRSESSARAWIADLERDNRRAHRDGIARRSRNLRRRLAREDPDVLASALHPNALALVDRLIAHGVQTIVLDECHHLLDHWALVVAYISARMRDTGRQPLLIGLTATLPSTDDEDEYDNYTSLLGEVDYEVPTPAVVKEGNLAPYRDFVWFTLPTPEEVEFLRKHDETLTALIGETLRTARGEAFLARMLQPDDDPALDADQRLAVAFSRDFALTESAARMLVQLSPGHPLVPLLPPESREQPENEQSIRVLARFALDVLLPDPASADTWDRIKRTLVDFGFTLTDRGIRRARDPLDTILATSAAKDSAVADILRVELSQPTSGEVRAVVVTDFALHGNTRGRLGRPAGALRTFDTLAADVTAGSMRPVLVTATHLRIPSEHRDTLLPALEERLGAGIAVAPVEDSPHVLDVDTSGHGSAAVVAAVSRLLTEGHTRLIVGTRGLLGEGWDCPAANTLIDLTAVATSSATQQLRGRTLRLDPAWSGKVAHNWTVTALAPSKVGAESAPDRARMRRKHSRIWGLLREDSTQVVRGELIALTFAQRGMLDQVLARTKGSSVDALNAAITAKLPTREESYRDWRIGEPYADTESTSAVTPARSGGFRTGGSLELVLAALVAVAGAAVGVFLYAAVRLGSLGAVGLTIAAVLATGALLWQGIPLITPLVQSARQLVNTPATYRRIAQALLASLHAAGRIGQQYGQANVQLDQLTDGSTTVQIEVALTGGSSSDRRMFATTLSELFGPVRTPRFLLQVDRGDPATSSSKPLLRLALWLATKLSPGTRYLPVPVALGRRREDAQRFALEWRRHVGPCTLHEVNSPEKLRVLMRARRHSEGAPEAAFVRETWS